MISPNSSGAREAALRPHGEGEFLARRHRVVHQSCRPGSRDSASGSPAMMSGTVTPELRQLVRLNPDAHRILARAERRHFRDTAERGSVRPLG